MTTPIHRYTHTEEQINIWSHFAGIILSLVGMVILLIKGINLQSTLHIVSYAIYGTSMLVLFSASTLYHSAKNPEKRKKLNIFDHAAIYFLIAGTYTPFTLLGLQGAWGWSIFGVAWGIGLAGIILKLFFTGRFNLLSTISYVAMGWIIVFALKPLIERFPFEGLMWLAAGGVFYTIGAVLYMFKKIPYNHAIFHFFVLAGAIAHFMGVLLHT
ncbi:MAG: hemolysin III family protein [Salinivirgaceae bacterium]